MAVRSRRLWSPYRNVAASTFETVYTVPAGRTARGSLMTLVNITNANRLVLVALVVSGGVRALWEGTIAGQTTQQVLAGWVGNPGDVVQLFVDAASAVDFAGYGSLLDGAPS